MYSGVNQFEICRKYFKLISMMEQYSSRHASFNKIFPFCLMCVGNHAYFYLNFFSFDFKNMENYVNILYEKKMVNNIQYCAQCVTELDLKTS